MWIYIFRLVCFFNHLTQMTTSSQIYIKSPGIFFSTGDIRIQSFQQRGRWHFSGLQSQRGTFEKKKKVLQRMWESYPWVWVNIGLFRLFQKLASHVCAIFFFFSSFSLSFFLSLGYFFFLFYFEHHSIALLFHLSATDAIQLKSTPSLYGCHNASNTVGDTGGYDQRIWFVASPLF